MQSQQVHKLVLPFLLITMGVLVLYGWMIDSTVITQINPTFTAMQFNTALCFVLSGMSVVLLMFKYRLFSRLTSASFGVLSLLTLIQYIFNTSFGIDQLFFNAQLVANATHPGRMSPTTAFCFSLSACALLCLSTSHIKKFIALFVEYGGIAVSALGSISLLGYLTGINSLESWHHYIKIAAHTSFGLILLGLAIFIQSQPHSQSRSQSINRLLKSYTIIVFLLTAQLHFNSQSVVLFIFLGFLSLTTHLRLENSQKMLNEEKAKALHNAKLALLGEMAASIAHEINNPLTIITGNLKILQNRVDSPEMLSKKIESISKATERIAKIVKGLKKFSRSEVKSDFKNVLISQITEEAFAMTEAKSKYCATPVICTIQSQASIFCDEIEIEQVLINLINNGIDAVKNSEEKWVKISLHEEKDSVVIQVRDSGNGIPKEIVGKLFQPFFTTKPIGEGTGLGLSIAKGILDDHDASLAILNNDPNTCFEIRFKKCEMSKAA